ncbi:uncharacterized protein [Nicotiana tomentosiformis]|uniref:uncharacterized protein n=1 Tax=Nicotiana tomentosiformis TaxID=4098 RepID=UPI00388CD2A3
MKSLSINVSLVDGLKQMHSYAKFMKDLVTKKRSMNFMTIKVTHQVRAIVHSMAPNLEDPGAFMIRCTIISAEFGKALYDLEESTNLMPYSIFKTLWPQILFLATGKSLCAIEAGELTFRPNSNEVCSLVDLVTDVIVDDTSDTINVGDMLEDVLLNFDDDERE